MDFAPTITHQLGFLYMAFAHQTDGQYVKEERIAVWSRLKGWAEMTQGEFAQMMDEVIIWYKIKLSEDSILPTVIEVAKELTDYPAFNAEQRFRALRDMKMIAKADANVIEEELEWIETIGEIWGVDKKDIDKLTGKSPKRYY